MADLFEFLIGTGMRKGEAFGLHWNDVHLTEGVLYVRCTLSAIDNNHLVPAAPGSPSRPASPPHSGTGRSQRPVRGVILTTRSPGWSSADPMAGRSDHLVLDRLHQLSEEAGVPRITVHDLRHLAATIMITAGVPLTVVSKTLRHSTLSSTANIHSHLTRQAAREAVDTIDRALTGAEKAGLETSRPAWLRPPWLRTHERPFSHQ